MKHLIKNNKKVLKKPKEKIFPYDNINVTKMRKGKYLSPMVRR